MYIEKLCEKTLSHSGQDYIKSIVKIKGGFLFGFCDDEGRDLLLNPLFISDNGRKIKIYFPPDHDDEILYSIIVPDKFM